MGGAMGGGGDAEKRCGGSVEACRWGIFAVSGMVAVCRALAPGA